MRRVKHGDTFKVALTVTRDNAPVDLNGVTITSQVRQKDDTLVADLTVTPIDLTNGQIRLRGDTDTWPVLNEALCWDVQFVEAGDTWSLPTQEVVILKDVTA